MILQSLQIANVTDNTYGNGCYWMSGGRSWKYNRVWPYTSFYISYVTPAGYLYDHVMGTVHSHYPSSQ